MKKHPEKYYLGFMVIFLLILLVSLTVKLNNEIKVLASTNSSKGEIETAFVFNIEKAETAKPVVNLKRPNITFIMGEDNGKKNFYYTEAESYYRLNEAEASGTLVTHCRSLEEVQQYLIEHKAKSGQPWGRVNMVLHSNEWSGLGVPLYPQGPRATAASMVEAIEEEELFPLSPTVVDEQTELILYGCGLGRNEMALEAIAHVFGVPGHEPIVRSTRYFVYYESQRYMGRPVSSQKYLADYWYAFYKTGYRPGDIKLSRQMNERYPDENMDWRDALTRTEPRWLGDTYHHTFRVPVVWWVTYPDEDERPELSTVAAQKEWLANQDELQDVIADYNISEEYFNWTFRETTYESADGTREPAIKAIGFSTILCVLQALTIPVEGDNGAMALEPAVTDTLYFAVVGN